MKILLIYPNCEGYGRIPIGLSLISASLKKAGHEVRLFDLTFKVSRNIDNEEREAIGTAKKVDTLSYWGEVTNSDIHQELKELIGEYNPRLVGITLIQNNYWTSVDLLKTIRSVSDAHIVAGGVFSTVSPQILLMDNLVDSVIMGEGEIASVELAKRIEAHKDYRDVSNLAYLKDGKVIRNPILGYVKLDDIPFQDLSIFDERHFMKPFDGRMVRAGYVELTRGCPFSCTYCVNYFLNEELYSHETKHIRFRDPENSINEIRELKSKYNFNFIFFTDENILVLPYKELKKYAELWNKYIKLPFYVTTRVEVATEDKVSLLRDMGCATVAFGIECGNEKYRREMLTRLTTNAQIIKAFKLCKKYGIRTTANNMFGFPYETEDLIFDTIKLNIDADPDSYSLSIFAPYIGTKLHEICLKEGYIEPGIPRKISMIDESILTMPQLSKDRIRELYANFVKYVSKEIAIPKEYQ